MDSTDVQETYNNLWKHPNLPLSYKLMIGELSIDEIKRAVWRSIKEEEYPPSPAKFRKLATESDFDFDASFDRFIAKEKLNDIEWFASQKVGFKCRGQWAEDRARKEWKAAIEYYMKLDKEGKVTRARPAADREHEQESRMRLARAGWDVLQKPC